jgi:GTP-binding protein
LWLAGRRSTGNKKNRPKTKKKKNTTTNNVTKGKKTKRNSADTKSKKGGASKNPMAGGGSSPEQQQSNQKAKKKVAPPWQTISKKDMDQNVKAENARRKIAQETGQHLTPHQLEEAQVSYQRSKSFLSPQDKALLAWKPFALNSNKHEISFRGAFLNKQLPPRLGTPEVAFLGRSNVGKSSLLNKLVGKSDLARVGKTPGATASVNLYGIFDTGRKQSNTDNRKALMGLVDLPGFGYAKLSKETKQSVQDTAEHYLSKRKELALGILLVDSRRTPSTDDKAVLAALYDMGLPLMVVATKVDKFSTQDKVDEALGVINRELGLPEGQPLCISCVTGTGIKDLWRIVMEACEGHVGELKANAETGGASQQHEELAGDNIDDNDDADFLDDGEVAYSQGYDWIQGSVVYESEGEEYDDGEYGFDTNDGGAGADEYYDDGFDDGYDDYDDFDGYGDEPAAAIPQKQTLKSLKQKARDMERRGEFGEF